MQLELISRNPEKDRNFERGGRSFYFFDFDDNVMFLSTPIFLFHKESGNEIAVSTGHFAKINEDVGKTGKWKDYEIRFEDGVGSFRRFRDLPAEHIEGGDHQNFVRDFSDALKRRAEHEWKGPSWDFFYHAVFNQRPISIITARGHSRETIRQGIEQLCRDEHLPHSPNYLSIYPVTNPRIQKELGDLNHKWSVPELKKRAIIETVHLAMERYGANPFHRFGMSDDDPANIRLVIEAMRELKKIYPENAFFAIDSSKHPVVKWEVEIDHNEKSVEVLDASGHATQLEFQQMLIEN